MRDVVIMWNALYGVLTCDGGGVLVVLIVAELIAGARMCLCIRREKPHKPGITLFIAMALIGVTFDVGSCLMS